MLHGSAAAVALLGGGGRRGGGASCRAESVQLPSPLPTPPRLLIPARLPAARPQVNRILAAHKAKNKLPIQYKIGPDPSSIDSCMVRGLAGGGQASKGGGSPHQAPQPCRLASLPRPVG